MALSAMTILEVRTTGSDTNGGGFVSGATGTDWSQQDSAQYSVTDGVTNGTTTITSATANFGVDVVGNLIYVQGGTGSVVAGWYQIVTRTDASTIIVDRSTGLSSGTGVTLHIGGALASPGQASAIASVIGMLVWIKSGTYSITSASTNIAGGCVSQANATTIVGYSTLRGDSGTPLLQASGISSFTLWTQVGVSTTAWIGLDGASLTSSAGMNFGSNAATAFGCYVLNCTNGGFKASSGNGKIIGCYATGCSSVTAISVTHCFFSVAAANSITGFASTTSGSVYSHCIAFNNNNAGAADGFAPTSSAVTFLFCTSVLNDRNGYRIANQAATTLTSCIGWANGVTDALATSASTNHLLLIGCAMGTIDSSIVAASQIDPITLTSSPFTDISTGDLSLNGEVSTGLSFNAGWFQDFFVAGTLSTPTGTDVGASRHPDFEILQPSDVRFGVEYTDTDGPETGTLVLPDETDVRSGVEYGGDGTEFTGSLSAGNGGQILGG